MKNFPSHEPRFTFNKEERLSRKKLIDELFKNGSSFYFHPFRIYYLKKSFESLWPAQVLITVSPRNFRHAVDRNRIKRLTREAYRLNKHRLLESLSKNNQQMLIGFVYSDKKIESFELIQKKMISILGRLAELNVSPEKNSK